VTWSPRPPTSATLAWTARRG